MNWSKEEFQYLLELIESNPRLMHRDLAVYLSQRFNRPFTENSVRKKLGREGFTKTQIVYTNRKNEKSLDMEKFFDELVQWQKANQEIDDRQTTTTARIDSRVPIGICFTGDWHVGAQYTDHEGMKKDFGFIRDTEGLYVVTMGDYSDNYITRSHPGGQFEQITQPAQQKAIVLHLFKKYFSEKLLAVLKGNHDNWEYKETGEDFVKYLAREMKAPYLWYGGEINIELGTQRYKIHAHHSYKYNSSLNTTNSQRNLFNNTHADVIALGHIHTNETHAKSVGGIDTTWMRTGSYKITDDYSQWIGGHMADNRVPMVILWPDQKKILPFRSIYDGVKRLNMVRSEYLKVKI